eukprot:NODE_454_length_1915_cov_56.099553_g447_i0.p1 GENE.NODE_454_length_1915_cov_56.099553_g447_i0~~NODE_454_length_1915_cov_56.099553_g447_i0.p1  ORF type:complete len:598 (-),score=85.85 NODE_454_length_1915_cov_56.099553_g447_i0:27-1820(-)
MPNKSFQGLVGKALTHRRKSVAVQPRPKRSTPSVPRSALSGKEKEKCRDAFNAAGVALSVRDVGALLMEVGEYASEDEIQKLAAKVGWETGAILNVDQFIGMLELRKAAYNEMQQDPDADTREAFRAFLDDAGKVRLDLLVEMEKDYGVEFGAEELLRGWQDSMQWEDFQKLFGKEAVEAGEKAAEEAAFAKVARYFKGSMPQPKQAEPTIRTKKEKKSRHHDHHKEKHRTRSSSRMESDSSDSDTVTDPDRQDTTVSSVWARASKGDSTETESPKLKHYLRAKVFDRLFPHKAHPQEEIKTLVKMIDFIHTAQRKAHHVTEEEAGNKLLTAFRKKHPQHSTNDRPQSPASRAGSTRRLRSREDSVRSPSRQSKRSQPGTPQRGERVPTNHSTSSPARPYSRSGTFGTSVDNFTQPSGSFRTPPRMQSQHIINGDSTQARTAYGGAPSYARESSIAHSFNHSEVMPSFHATTPPVAVDAPSDRALYLRSLWEPTKMPGATHESMDDSSDDDFVSSHMAMSDVSSCVTGVVHTVAVDVEPAMAHPVGFKAATRHLGQYLASSTPAAPIKASPARRGQPPPSSLVGSLLPQVPGTQLMR